MFYKKICSAVIIFLISSIILNQKALSQNLTFHNAKDWYLNKSLILNGKTIVKKCHGAIYSKVDDQDSGVYMIAPKPLKFKSFSPQQYFTEIYDNNGIFLLKNDKPNYDMFCGRLRLPTIHGFDGKYIYLIAKEHKMYNPKGNYVKYKHNSNTMSAIFKNNAVLYGLADEFGKVIVPPRFNKFFKIEDGAVLLDTEKIKFLPNELIAITEPMNPENGYNYDTYPFYPEEWLIYNLRGERIGNHHASILDIKIINECPLVKYSESIGNNGKEGWSYYLPKISEKGLPIDSIIFRDILPSESENLRVIADEYQWIINVKDLTVIGNKEHYRERIPDVNFYRTIDNNRLGLQFPNGGIIIPAVCDRIEIEGHEACTGDNKRKLKFYDKPVLVASHANLGGLKTGYGYFSSYKSVINYEGKIVIPFSRGYDEITPMIEMMPKSRRRNSRHYVPSGPKPTFNPRLWYSFAIGTNGLSIIGICDVHGKELWRGVNKTDISGMIDYDRYRGFYYQNTSGEKTWLNIMLPDEDIDWLTSIVPERDEWSMDYTLAHTSKKWNKSADGLYRNVHEEKDFRWVEVHDGYQHKYAEDIYGNILVGPKENSSFSFVTYKKNPYTKGLFFRSSLDKTMHSEVFTLQGNPIISLDRGYQSCRLDDDAQYIITQNNNVIGVCDLNGYEVAPPKYKTVYYDGYEFEGELPNGRVENYTVHARPPQNTHRNKTVQSNNSNWYYSNTPWLWLPYGNYIPTFTMDWNTPAYDYSNPELVSGGNSDYKQSTVNQTSSSSHKSKCPYCNGTGKKLVDDYSAPNFGNDIPMKKCDICGANYPANKAHSHVTCGYCGGTGFLK